MFPGPQISFPGIAEKLTIGKGFTVIEVVADDEQPFASVPTTV
jgi:hypothetical protein